MLSFFEEDKKLYIHELLVGNELKLDKYQPPKRVKRSIANSPTRIIFVFVNLICVVYYRTQNLRRAFKQ